jgi:hypothetical protein
MKAVCWKLRRLLSSRAGVIRKFISFRSVGIQTDSLLLMKSNPTSAAEVQITHVHLLKM